MSLTNRNSLTEKIINRIRTIWLELVTGFLWWAVGLAPSHFVRLFFYKLFGMKIGKGSNIHMMARIYDPKHISIGEDTIIGERVTLDGRKQIKNSDGGITIGNHTALASEVMIWNSQHDLEDENFKPLEKKVVIKDYVFIGPRAIILPGVTIHDRAVIAASAVVTKDVGPGEIVAGIPAKTIGLRKITNPSYKLGRARLFQ